MAHRAPQLLLWDAPWFPRQWEGAAWFVVGAIATCTLSILACFATDAFSTEVTITIGPIPHTAQATKGAPRTCDGAARELVIAKPPMAAARASVDIVAVGGRTVPASVTLRRARRPATRAIARQTR